jgi:hypothetical protein
MAINESFNNLVNDITTQVLQEVQQQVHSQIATAVTQRVQQILTPESVSATVTRYVVDNIQQFRPDMTAFEEEISAHSQQLVSGMTDTVDKKINSLVEKQLNAMDMSHFVKEHVLQTLNGNARHLALGEAVIPGSAVDHTTLTVLRENITAGVFKDFVSTGIDDRATHCQVTIMDAGTVFENTVYAAGLEVKGSAVIDGDLLIRGSIPRDSQTYQNIIQDVDTVMETNYQRVFDRIRDQGIDVSKLSINNQLLIDGDSITTAVVNSKLQSVGVLRDLQTAGETLLSETLYTSGRRVGINTMEPSTALSIWDEEIELGVGKIKLNTAQFGTRREHDLVLSSNGRSNIVLKPDGNTEVTKLKIGNMQFSTSGAPPADNQPRGTVVFNENPNIGGPVGWISLGDARWANFGIID